MYIFSRVSKAGSPKNPGQRTTLAPGRDETRASDPLGGLGLTLLRSPTITHELHTIYLEYILSRAMGWGLRFSLYTGGLVLSLVGSLHKTYVKP